MKKLMKAICLILSLCTFCALFAACSDNMGQAGKSEYTGDANVDRSHKAYFNYEKASTSYGSTIDSEKVALAVNSMKVEDFVPSDKTGDYVLIKVKDYGSIVVLLRYDVAPGTVENFKKLVHEGFYSGTIFHRIIEDFMIQGGGLIVKDNPNGNGTIIDIKEADTITGEFRANGFVNNLKHVRGVISMARSENYNSASSQFFIMHATKTHLDGGYAAFGYVLAGMEVVDKIAACKDFLEEGGTMPMYDIIIESVTFVEPK